MATREQVILLYRQILKAAQHFPSIKKAQIIQDIKAEFRDYKNTTDATVIRRQMEIGVRSLQQLQTYSKGIDKQSSEWNVFLQGSCS